MKPYHIVPLKIKPFQAAQMIRLLFLLKEIHLIPVA